MMLACADIQRGRLGQEINRCVDPRCSLVRMDFVNCYIMVNVRLCKHIADDCQLILLQKLFIKIRDLI
jgi:hypothetical protein